MEDYYGILTTYNPHTKLWYAFHNRDVADYFSTPSKIIYGRGNNAVDAIKNYIRKENESN